MELPPPSLQRQPDTIKDTQFYEKTNNKKNIYKNILASIGLDSPSASMENDVIDQGGDTLLVDTPIRNSASNLIALEQHIQTSRQGRMWNEETSPR